MSIRSDRLALFLLTMTLLVANASLAQIEVAKLLASDIEAEDEFASSVHIDGDRAVVGSPRESTGATAAGAVYVFDRDGNGTWSEVAKIQLDQVTAFGFLGASVAVSGDRILASAPGSDEARGIASGAVYVFERQAGGSWTQVAEIPPFGLLSGFGAVVDLEGDRALVGGTQAAQIFERNGSGVWSHVATLTPDDPNAGDVIGLPVALSGDRVVMGGPNESPGGVLFSGAAYIFERDGLGMWSPPTKIVRSDAVFNHRFGSSVDISGSTVFVGALGDTTVGLFAGAAYVYAPDGGGGWTQIDKILSSDLQAGDQLGYSVGVSGDHAWVGARFESSAGPGAGAAYALRRDASGDWSEVAKVQSSDIDVADAFGFAVDVDGERAIVSALRETTGGEDAGAAYIFEPGLPVSVDIKPQTCPNPFNPRRRGVLPVAVLGSPALDVLDIDPTTVKLAGVEPLRHSIEDAGSPTPQGSQSCDCSIEIGDGIDDLSLKFSRADIVAAVGPVGANEVLVLSLTGSLYDGTPIQGQDCMVVVPD